MRHRWYQHSSSQQMTTGIGTQMPTESNLTDHYDRLVSGSCLEADASQAAAIKALSLLQTLACMSLSSEARTSNLKENSSQPAISGSYLYGPVGSGKTMCLDLFFKTLPLPQANPTNPFRLGDDYATPEALSALEMHDSPGTHQRRTSSMGSSSASSDPAPATAQMKRRLHFHEFMLTVHKRLHALQQSRPKILSRTRLGLPVYRYAEPEVDPLDQVAAEIATHTKVLCLDELHVTDVADAMILSRLLEGILHFGTLVVFTSNRPPKDLYKGGLSRKYFEPFITQIEMTCAVLRVGSGHDYRSSNPKALPPEMSSRSGDSKEALAIIAIIRGSLGTPPSNQAGILFLPSARMNASPSNSQQQLLPLSWSALTSQCLEPPQASLLPVPYGRTLWFPLTACMDSSPMHDPPGGNNLISDTPALTGQPVPAEGTRDDNTHTRFTRMAYVRFGQLCGNEGLSEPGSSIRATLGPSDFLTICRAFKVIFVEGIPQFATTQRDEARRFVSFLDVLYEERCSLVCSAACAPDQMFLRLLAEARDMGVNPNLGRSVKYDLSDIEWKGLMSAGGPQAESSPSASGGGGGDGDDRRPTEAPSSVRKVSSRSLRQEEVLMFNRAISRLGEICQLVPQMSDMQT